MKPIGNLILVILSFTLIVSATQRSKNGNRRGADAEQQVREAERKREEARKRGDSSLLSRLVADDFMEINRSGRVLRKADFVAEPAVQNLVVDDSSIRVYGNSAVVTGRASFVGRDGKPVVTRFTRIWVKRNRGWVLVSHQGTTVAE
jgi:hypothetical protein